MKNDIKVLHSNVSALRFRHAFLNLWQTFSIKSGDPKCVYLLARCRRICSSAEHWNSLRYGWQNACTHCWYWRCQQHIREIRTVSIHFWSSVALNHDQRLFIRESYCTVQAFETVMESIRLGLPVEGSVPWGNLTIFKKLFLPPSCLTGFMLVAHIKLTSPHRIVHHNHQLDKSRSCRSHRMFPENEEHKNLPWRDVIPMSEWHLTDY